MFLNLFFKIFMNILFLTYKWDVELPVSLTFSLKSFFMALAMVCTKKEHNIVGWLKTILYIDCNTKA